MADEPIDPSTFFEPSPTASQKALWDKFVEEYVKDYNGYAAAMRIGFNSTYAQEYARVFLGYSYIQRRIMEYKNKPQEDSPDKLAKYKQRIESIYIMAMECGDPKVAVVAATKLGEMYGLTQAPDKSGEELGKVVDFFKNVAKAVPD